MLGELFKILIRVPENPNLPNQIKNLGISLTRTIGKVFFKNFVNYKPMNNQLNNLEVIAEMANLRLKAKVFQEIDGTVFNFQHYHNAHKIRITENIEKKIFTIICNGKIENRYSNQETVDLIIQLYTEKNEN